MNDNRTILVVDDDSQSLRVLTDTLTGAGYRVRPADSGELALASVGAIAPELILLDIRMPGMDGFEVCRRLKANQKSRGIPVVFLSAAGQVEDRVHALRLGAADFISKPFQAPELLARVHIHMELGLLRAHLEQQVAERTAELRLANERLCLELEERRRAEHELRESEERFRNLANRAPVGIWVMDADQGVTFYNRRALAFLGRKMADRCARRWTDFVHPDDLEEVSSKYRSAVVGRRSFRIECRVRRATGKYRWMLHTGIPRFIGGIYSGYIGTSLDITDLKRAHERMIVNQKLESLGVLSAGVAHDFNNLLGSIMAEADLALSDHWGGFALPRESGAHRGHRDAGIGDREPFDDLCRRSRSGDRGGRSLQDYRGGAVSDAAPAEQDGRDRCEPGQGPAGGAGEHGADPAGCSKPDHECFGSPQGQGRKDHGQDGAGAHRQGRRRQAQDRSAVGRLLLSGGFRHGLRHECADTEQGLRPVLYHQIRGARFGPRGGAGHPALARRRHHGSECTGERLDV